MSFIGVVEIFRTAQIKQAATFNFTPFIGVALVFIVVTIPLARFTDWLVARDRRAIERGGRPMTRRRAPDRGPAQVVRDARGPARHRPHRRRARGRLPDRRVGLAASRRSCAASTCSSRSTPGGSSSRATRSRREGVRRGPDPAPDRHRLPGVQPVPAHVACSTTSRSRRARCSRCRPRRGRGRRRPSCSRGSAWPTSATSIPDRLSGGQQQRVAIVRALAMKPGPPAARRGHERPRPGARRRGPRRHPRARGRRA